MSDQRDEFLQSLLKNWKLLGVEIMHLPEKEVVTLYEMEKANRGRLRVMMRIYNRMSKLRSIREKQEMAACAKG